MTRTSAKPRAPKPKRQHRSMPEIARHLEGIDAKLGTLFQLVDAAFQENKRVRTENASMGNRLTILRREIDRQNKTLEVVRKFARENSVENYRAMRLALGHIT